MEGSSLRFSFALALLLLPLQAQAQDEAGVPPSPEQEGSHEEFQKLLVSARTSTYEQIVATYDAYIAAHPEAGPTAPIERCRFVLMTQSDEEYEDVVPEKVGDCTQELLERFPLEGAAHQLRMEQLWSEEAIAYGLATFQRTDIAWSDAQLAAFLARLAAVYDGMERLPQAAAYAKLARARLPSIDVGTILARHHLDAGRRETAILELLQPHEEEWTRYQAITLLIEIKAYQQALAAIDQLLAEGKEVGAMQHAQALEGAGKTDAARAKYGELSAEHWQRALVLERLFYIDLERGDETRALAAYEALRDTGYESDPLLRHRLALALEYPTLGWQWRDLLGLLGLFGASLLCMLWPVLFIVPIHYIGLVRRERGYQPPPEPPRWTLRDLWVITGALTLVSIAALYTVSYNELVAMFSEDPNLPAASALELARSLVITSVGSCIVVAVYLQRDDVRLFRSNWSAARTAGAVAICIAIVVCVQRITRVVGDVLELEDAQAAPATVIPTVMDSLHAVNEVYGPAVLLFDIALLVPFYEEVVFRSVFLLSVARYLPVRWALFIQAVAFTLVHDEPARFPALFALGLLAGVLVLRSGGLLPAIALHVTVNVIAGASIVALQALGVSAQQHAHLRHGRSSVSTLAAYEQRDAAALAVACDADQLDACTVLGQRTGRGALPADGD